MNRRGWNRQYRGETKLPLVTWKGHTLCFLDPTDQGEENQQFPGLWD